MVETAGGYETFDQTQAIATREIYGKPVVLKREGNRAATINVAVHTHQMDIGELIYNDGMTIIGLMRLSAGK